MKKEKSLRVATQAHGILQWQLTHSTCPPEVFLLLRFDESGDGEECRVRLQMAHQRPGPPHRRGVQRLSEKALGKATENVSEKALEKYPGLKIRLRPDSQISVPAQRNLPVGPPPHHAPCPESYRSLSKSEFPNDPCRSVHRQWIPTGNQQREHDCIKPNCCPRVRDSRLAGQTVYGF